jgi:transposase
MNYSIGIDWADESHLVCIREYSSRRIIAEFQIEHSAGGIQKFNTTCNALKISSEDCGVAIEAKHGLLVNYLLLANYSLHPIPPAVLKDYRGRQRRTGAKSDRDDARLLADALCLDLELYPPLANDSALVRELQAMYRARKQLVQTRVRALNQLRQNLKTYFPVALKLFSRLDSKILHAFLNTFPTQKLAEAATAQELESFFAQQGYKRPDRMPAIVAMLDEPGIPVPDWQAEAGQRYTMALLDQLAILTEHINSFEMRLTELLDKHEDAPLFLSLPRVGTVLAAGLLGEIGDCRDKFDSASAIQALAGTAPVTKSSGSTRSVSFRFACNKPLRDLLQEFARQSARSDASPWARGYLEAQIERGHSASRAYRALANRWVCIIHRMWKDHSRYSEAYHLRNIAQRGVKSSQFLQIKAA